MANNCCTANLIAGINFINDNLCAKMESITGIQFEDGSGHKFNYQLNGGNWQFVDTKARRQVNGEKVYIKP